MKDNRGFTLIELLTVVAIIGLLASVVLSAVDSARVRARDAQRVSDIKQMERALELYYGEHGHYPISSNCNPGESSPNEQWCRSSITDANGNWIENLTVQGALAEYFPDGDPVAPNQSVTPGAWLDPNTYFYLSYPSGPTGTTADGYAGQWYIIITAMETSDHVAQRGDGVQTCGAASYDYGIDDLVWTFGKSCQR